MVALQPLVSEFTIIGRLEDLVVSAKGKIKYLSLSTPEEDYLIAVAKEPKALAKYLKPGCHLKVTGMRKYKLHQGVVEYKAYSIELIQEDNSHQAIATNQTKAKILVCQGSSCSKKGGQAICQILQAELAANGITNKVKIQTTGCLKQCKQAPMLIMPGTERYSKVKPEQVSQLITKHFPI